MNIEHKVYEIRNHKVIPMANTKELFIFKWFDGRMNSEEYNIIKRKDFPIIKDIRDFENLSIDSIWGVVNRDYEYPDIHEDIASKIEIVKGFWWLEV